MFDDHVSEFCKTASEFLLLNSKYCMSRRNSMSGKSSFSKEVFKVIRLAAVITLSIFLGFHFQNRRIEEQYL